MSSWQNPWSPSAQCEATSSAPRPPRLQGREVSPAAEPSHLDASSARQAERGRSRHDDAAGSSVAVVGAAAQPRPTVLRKRKSSRPKYAAASTTEAEGQAQQQQQVPPPAFARREGGLESASSSPRPVGPPRDYVMYSDPSAHHSNAAGVNSRQNSPYRGTAEASSMRSAGHQAPSATAAPPRYEGRDDGLYWHPGAQRTEPRWPAAGPPPLDPRPSEGLRRSEASYYQHQQPPHQAYGGYRGTEDVERFQLAVHSGSSAAAEHSAMIAAEREERYAMELRRLQDGLHAYRAALQEEQQRRLAAERRVGELEQRIRVLIATSVQQAAPQQQQQRAPAVAGPLMAGSGSMLVNVEDEELLHLLAARREAVVDRQSHQMTIAPPQQQQHQQSSVSYAGPSAAHATATQPNLMLSHLIPFHAMAGDDGGRQQQYQQQQQPR